MAVMIDKETKEAVPVTAFLKGDQLAKDIAKVNDAARGKFLTVVGMALCLMKNYDPFQSPTHFKMMDLLKKFDKNFNATGKNYGKVGPDRTIDDVMKRRQDRWNFLFIAGMWFQDLFNYDFRRTEQCIIPYATQEGEISFCAYNTGVGWRNIIEKMHMTATLTKWYDEHGRHEIFAGGKNVKMENVDHGLVLTEGIVTTEEQHDLDKLGIAKNAREEKIRARDARAEERSCLQRAHGGAIPRSRAAGKASGFRKRLHSARCPGPNQRQWKRCQAAGGRGRAGSGRLISEFYFPSLGRGRFRAASICFQRLSESWLQSCEITILTGRPDPGRLTSLTDSSASVLVPLPGGVFMIRLRIAALLALALLLTACGSSNTNGSNSSINGNWTATLLDVSGKPVFGFTTALSSNGSNGIIITNFSFTTATPCFGSGSTETGGFTLGGNFNGVTTGTFTLTVQSGLTGSNGSNTLTLQGTVNNNTVSGTWTIAGTGAGCAGSGAFTMIKG